MLIRCLGPIAVLHENGETHLPASARHIVAVLVAAGPNGVTADRLADEIYGDDLSPGWEGGVRKGVSRLRKAIGIAEIVSRNGRYVLNVPASDVDLWMLLDIDAIDVVAMPEHLMQDLLSGQPFGGVEPSPLLRDIAEAITIARLQLVQKLAAASESWSAKTLLDARAFAAHAHFRDDVFTAVIELHLTCGQTASAADFAEKARRYLADDMGSVFSASAQAAVDKIALAITNAPVERATGEQLRGRVIGLFESAADAGMITRRSLRSGLVANCPETGALVTGDSGSGKSALVRSAMAVLATEGHHVLWLSGQRATSSAYQPFLTAMPSLEEDLKPLLQDGGNDLLRSRCWSAGRRRLEREFIDLPLLIVIDDAQWLDSHSQAFAIFLASTQDPGSPTVTIIGRSDPTERDWHRFSPDLDRLGLPTIEVGAFDQDELLELIALHHQQATSKQRVDLAVALHERRASLPAVAHELVRSAEPTTLSIAQVLTGNSAVWTPLVVPEFQRIAATAAILGMRFRSSDVAELADATMSDVADASDALCDSGIWVAEQRPNEFSFRHVLIHAEFDDIFTGADRRRFHLRAATAAEQRDDVHAHAAHLVEASAIADSTVVVDALLTSARAFQARGSYREAVEAFAHARRFVDDELDTDDLLKFSAAVSFSGGDGWDLRAAAFERSHRTHDATRCLDIALYGALHTENVMGQPRRLKMLQRVDANRLDANRRTEHAAAMAREHGLLGSHDLAIATATAAIHNATTPDDRFIAWLGAWASYRSLPPQMWPALPEDRSHVTRPELVSRRAQVEFGLALVTGDDSSARRHLSAFIEHPSTKVDPLRSWHAALAQTTMSFVDGNWNRARGQADTCFTAASDQGVVAAFSTRLAQEFMLQWVAKQHGALLETFNAAAPDVHHSVLAQAAFAITLAQHDDQREQAHAMITNVVQQALDQESPLSLGAAALLASAPSSVRDEEINEKLRSILKPFLGSAVVPGAVLSHLGPASWSISHLSAEAEERVELLRQAAAESDRWNLRLWQVISLRDLGHATSDHACIARARATAMGTNLEMLL